MNRTMSARFAKARFTGSETPNRTRSQINMPKLKKAHWQEFFIDASRHESQRGLSLVCAAMIDDLLGRSIKSILVDHEATTGLLEGFNAPLGTFSARILAAFALGVLSKKEYGECKRFQKMRNVFAHTVHASFNDQNIKDISANLEFAWRQTETPNSPRQQYAPAAAVLILRLTHRPDEIKKRKCKRNNWPEYLIKKKSQSKT
jgi:mannitol operon repressor